MMKKSNKRKSMLTAALTAALCLFALVFAACGKTTEKYTVTFVNYDDSVLCTVQIEEGENAEYDAAIPERTATAEYTYSFAGWSTDGETVLESLPPVTGDVTYKAVFTTEERTYDVTFLSEDGSEVLYTAQGLKYDSTAVYAGTTPVKDATEQYSYEFVGWGAEKGSDEPLSVIKVTGDMNVYAIFEETPRQYVVLFKSEDGKTTLGSVTVSYGSDYTEPAEKPEKEATAQFSYEFVGWSKEKNSEGEAVTDKKVTGNLVLYAKFSERVNCYDVVFVNHDDTELYRIEDVEYGTSLVLNEVYEGEDPAKETDEQYSYTFAGWGDAEGEPLSRIEVTGETKIYALFEEGAISYTVTFMSEDGTKVLFTKENAEYGQIVEYEGDTPVKEGDVKYVFVGWSNEKNSAGETLSEVVALGDITVYAKFETYNLKIDYVYENGGQAAPSHYELTDGTYEVFSPVLKGYVADLFRVSGTVSGSAEIKVTYTEIDKLTFDVYGKIPSSALDGSGTAEDPYLIATAADFVYFAEQVNGGNDYEGKFLRLTANLDLNGEAVTVGSAATATADYTIKNAFAGTFDGNGHVIKGRNVAGAFSGYFAAVTGTIENLAVIGELNGNGRLGGIAVVLKDGMIKNCVNYVNITGSIVELGGIAAVNWGGTIENCVNFGAITGTGSGTAYNFGGIVGYNYGGGRVENCVNYGDVSSKKVQTGGVVGTNREGRVVGCENYGAVSATGTDLGGVVGYNVNGTVEKCVNRGTVMNTAANRTGGVVGYNITGGKVIDCENYGAVNGFSVVGGIVGNTENSAPATEVLGCVNYGEVVSSKGVAGGIAGYAKGKVENCVNRGDVSGAEGEIGGIAGSIQSEAGSVAGCENYGSVSGQNYVGGIAGDVQQKAAMSDNTNKGGVNGNDFVGGVVGNIYETAGTVAENVNEGVVQGQGENVGDIAGADAFAQ